MTSSISDFVVSLGTDGRIRSQGTVSEALAKDSVLMKELKEEKAALEKAEHTIEGEEHAEEATDAVKTADGKLIVAEEIAEGHVGWPASECRPAHTKKVVFISFDRSENVLYCSWREVACSLLGSHAQCILCVRTLQCDSNLVPRLLVCSSLSPRFAIADSTQQGAPV